MSLTLTLTGKNNILTARYFPALDLSDDDYELGLTNFETYNTIPNIDSTNNRFYYDDDDKVIIIPEGSYELTAIAKYLKAAILLRRRRQGDDGDDGDDAKYRIYDYDENDAEQATNSNTFVLRANENTMRSEIKCAYRVNFVKPNNIGAVLGFSSNRVLKPNIWYASDEPVNIMNVNTIRVECNITTGAYNNGQLVHTIHEFAVNVPPGYKLSVTPMHVIYLPVIARNVTEVTVHVVDQRGRLIDFRGEEVSVRLHIRRRRR